MLIKILTVQKRMNQKFKVIILIKQKNEEKLKKLLNKIHKKSCTKCKEILEQNAQKVLTFVNKKGYNEYNNRDT